MRKLRVAAATLLSMALLAGARSGRAETLADHLPADAVAYAGWAGADALGPAYQNSNLKTFLDALKLPELFRENFAKEMAKNNGPEKAEQAKLVEDLVGTFTGSPGAFSIGPLVTLPNGKPFPEVAFVARVGAARATDLADRMTRSFAQHRKPEDPPAGVFASGEFLTVHVGGPGIEEKLKRVTPADSLSANPAFKKAMAQVNGGKEPAAAFYVDGQTVLSLVSTAIEQSADNPQLKQYWPIVREGLGVDALRGVAWAGNFEGRNWQSSTFVGMTERRVGLLSFFDPRPLSDNALRYIPATATSAGVFRFDGPRFLADLQRVATLVSPEAPRQLDRAFAQIFAITGVDVKLDLLPSLGDEFIVYGSPDAAGNSLRGLTLVNKLKDPARAEQAFTALENITNMTLTQRAPDAKVQFRTENLAAPFDKVVAHVIATEQVSPAWTIHEGVFYFAMSLPTLQSAVERGNGAAGPQAGGSLAENPQYAALRRSLGQEAISSFAYADLVKSAPETYELVNRAVERAARENTNLNFKLPPLDRITPALGPVLQVYWTDAEGFHGKEIAPFPMAAALSPSQLLFLRLSESMQPRRAGAGLP